MQDNHRYIFLLDYQPGHEGQPQTHFSFGLPTRTRKRIISTTRTTSIKTRRTTSTKRQPQTHFSFGLPTRTRKKHRTTRTPPTKTTKTKTVKTRTRTRTRTIGTTKDTFFFFWITNQDKEKHRTTKTKTVKTRNKTRTRTIGTTTDTFFLLDYQPGQEEQLGHHQQGQPRQNSQNKD